MCINCIRSKVDITEGIQRQIVLFQCRGCERYLRPPWTVAPPESKELLALCLRKIRGLKQVKLVDAEFVWTEPHSRRIKVNVTIQKEVFNVVLQQSFIVAFIIEAKTCEDCIMESIQHSNRAVVQVRQKVEHKRTFYFLEQQIIKANMHRKAAQIESQPDGLDFNFPERSDARTFILWLKSVVPVNVGTARQLLSQDFTSNIVKYKYSYIVDILPICKDDLIVLPRKLCGITGLDPLCLCYKVTNLIFLINPFTSQRAEINVEKFNNAPFRSLMTTQSLVEYTVLGVSFNPNRREDSGNKRRFQVEEVTVCRSDRLGNDDAIVTTNTHLGSLLHEGDTVLGYDLSSAVFNDDDLKPLGDRQLPDCVLVRKSFPNFRKMNQRRNWKLHQLDKEEAETNRKANPRENADYEHFMMDLEEDEDMRTRVNIYKDTSVGELVINGEVEPDAPIIPLEEMLEEMNLDEEVRGDDIVLEGTSEEEN